MGKTSLLLELESRILELSRRRKRSPLPLPVYVSCQRHHGELVPLLGDLCDAVAEALSRRSGRICPPQVRGQAQAAISQGRLDTGLESLALWAFEEDQRTYRILLLVDALHRLQGKPSLAELPAKLQPLVNQQRLTVLLSGRQALTQELRDDVSPLAALLTQHHDLGPLSRGETRALVELASGSGWPVTPDAAAKAYLLTGGHPYRLQYYLQGALAGHHCLSEDALLAIHQPATLTYLNGLLLPRPQNAARAGATVFVSYSQKDEAEKEQLMTHLGVLAHDHSVIPWSDDRIGAGEDWEEVIRRAIDKARVAVLLISANFLTSKFILEEEVPRILKRRQADGLTVVPVIAKPCAWHEHEWLAALGAKPKKGTPVWRDGGQHADEELAKIAREIAKMLRPGG